MDYKLHQTKPLMLRVICSFLTDTILSAFPQRPIKAKFDCVTMLITSIGLIYGNHIQGSFASLHW